jgi:hypothetical protein
VEDDFYQILINLDVVDCRGFVFREGPKNGALGDFEGDGHFEKSVENGRGAEVPPVARYPSRSQGAVAILCPHRQALGARLAEHPISLGDRAVGVGDTVAVGSLGTCLQGTATLGAGLGEVEQEGGTVGTDHLGAVEQDLGNPLGVTHEGGEAGGGDQLDHGSRGAGGGGGFSPSLDRILADRWEVARVET